MDNIKINSKYKGLSKLFLSFLKNDTISFLYEKEIDDSFNLDNIKMAFEHNLLYELSKNLNYFYIKFLEIPK